MLPPNMAIGSSQLRTACALNEAERTRASAALSPGLFVRASATRRLINSVVMTTALARSRGFASSPALPLARLATAKRIVPKSFITRVNGFRINGKKCANGDRRKAHYGREEENLR